MRDGLVTVVERVDDGGERWNSIELQVNFGLVDLDRRVGGLVDCMIE